jgi:hypothetical protein
VSKRRIAILTVSVVAALGLAVAREASSRAPPTPSASASAGIAKRKPPARPRPKPLAEIVVPKEPSDPPEAEEWRDAPMVAPTRTSSRASRRCRAYVVREWWKLNCDLPAGMIRQITGETKGVLLWVTPTPEQGLVSEKPMAQIIAPMRPGRPSVFQIYELSGGEYDGFWSEPSFLLDVQWPEGAAQPTVVLR